MQRKWLLAAAFALLGAFAALAQSAPESTTDNDKFSYALGMSFGKNFRKQGLELNPAVFAKAFETSFNDGQTAMTDQEMQAVLAAAAQLIRKKLAEKGDAAQKEGEAFLAENKKKDGVVTLPSGLQYKILRAGTGEKPTLNDTVLCNYKGTLINGTEFDASQNHGGPLTFPVKGVIPGWTEALQLMPVGSRWQIFVPSNLAFGAQGPADIGPNATLIFDLELVSIQKPAQAAADAGSK